MKSVLNNLLTINIYISELTEVIINNFTHILTHTLLLYILQYDFDSYEEKQS